MESGKLNHGIDPSSGTVLWESPHEKGLQLIGLGEDLILTNKSKGFTLYSLGNTSDVTALSPSDMGTGTGKTGLKEIWSNENIVFEFDVPSRYKGYLYGFKSRFLTCLNLETGETIWSSREAGWGMAILVDGHLAIISYCHAVRTPALVVRSKSGILVRINWEM